MRLSTKISLLVSVPTVLGIAMWGGVVYMLSKSDMSGTLSSWLVAAGALAVTIGLTTSTVWILARQITQPIQALSAAVARIALGDLSQEVPVRSHDELGLLSQRFSDMTRQLSNSYRSLEASMQDARERRAELESSINGLRQGFILTDTESKVLMANAAATAIIRGDMPISTVSDGTIISLSEIERNLPADLELTAKIQQTLHDGKLAKYSDLPLRGRSLNLYLSPVLSTDGPIGCVLLLEDVTEERIIARSRDEFFSIASHELRTPLTAIRGNASMLQQYFPEVMQNAEVKEMVSDIHDSTVRLIEIVNDFLDTSRLEQGKMKFNLEVVSLQSVIEKTVYEMEGLSRSKHVAISFDQAALETLPKVYADTSRVTQVVYNLIGNAMKFTDKGEVAIKCVVQDQSIKIYVSDTGMGISPEGQQLLFHKFQQSTANILTRDNTRGTGLGLYISKLLVEHMGGELKLEGSEVGKGSTFSFTLPVATPDQIEAANRKSAASAAAAATDAAAASEPAREQVHAAIVSAGVAGS